MSKVVRLTERDLTKLVNKIISEQSKAIQKAVTGKKPIQQKTSGDLHPIPKNHPIFNPLWVEMTNNVEGEGVETIKYIPNKMLVIDAFGNKYTITKG
jgi:hypothetical protein